MGEMGVPDMSIDAFCDITPKSMLARHYIGYTPKQLKHLLSGLVESGE